MRISRRMALAGGNKKRQVMLVQNTQLSSLSNTDSVISGDNVYSPVAAAAGEAYAVFVSGYAAGSASTKVYADVKAYNTSLTQISCASLGSTRGRVSEGSIGDYAIFAGGWTRKKAGYQSSYVDAYNTSLTRSTLTSLSCSRQLISHGTEFSGKLFFAGGGSNFGDDESYTYSNIDIYDSSLTRSNINMSVKRGGVGAGTNDKYLILAGGQGPSTPSEYNQDNLVEAVDSSLTLSIATSLTTSGTRNNNFCLNTTGHVGDYVVVALMEAGISEAFDCTLTKRACEGISHSQGYYYGTAEMDDALVYACGGCDVIDGYDKSLTKYEAGAMFSGHVLGRTVCCVLGQKVLIYNYNSSFDVWAYSMK